MTRNGTHRLWTNLVLAAALTVASPGFVRAQTILSTVSENWSESLWAQEFLNAERFEPDTVRQTATPRLRMFGMPAGFLVNPLGLEDEDEAKLANDPAYSSLFKKDDDFKNVQLAMGMDNPFFDLRRPGSVGGIGYYQVYSQVQVLDTGATSVCVNLQTFTPAGVQWGGIANGPSYVLPAFSVFHDLGKGTALQGFVSENLCSGAGWDDNWGRKVYYGVAWQCPLFWTRDNPHGLYFFVQALGHANYDPARDSTHPAFNFMPGLQWRVSDNCWLSLGGYQRGLVCCSWQF